MSKLVHEYDNKKILLLYCNFQLICSVKKRNLTRVIDHPVWEKELCQNGAATVRAVSGGIWTIWLKCVINEQISYKVTYSDVFRNKI